MPSIARLFLIKLILIHLWVHYISYMNFIVFFFKNFFKFWTFFSVKLLLEFFLDRLEDCSISSEIIINAINHLVNFWIGFSTILIFIFCRRRVFLVLSFIFNLKFFFFIKNSLCTFHLLIFHLDLSRFAKYVYYLWIMN